MRPSLPEFVVAQALKGGGDARLLESLCARMIAEGVPLLRAALGVDLLHPTIGGRIVIWRRGGQTAVEQTPREVIGLNEPYPHPGEITVDQVSRALQAKRRNREDVPDAPWRRNPFARMYYEKKTELRLTPGQGEARDYPMLSALADQGATDYAAFMNALAADVGFIDVESVYNSWTIDRPGGFSGREVEMLTALQPPLSLALALSATASSARDLLGTYLGIGAASRVLEGEVERGRAQPLRAVVWLSDLVHFTRLSDEHPTSDVLTMLNAYAERLVEAVAANGGEVLKFMGDGILAIFPEDGAPAAARALRAADAARAGVTALNAERAAAGLPMTDFTLALHTGDLLFGNFGAADRLDFTVLGPAVNQASRMLALSRTLEQPVILSAEFAEALPDGQRARLAGIGRYALRGVARPQHLYAPVAE